MLRTIAPALAILAGFALLSNGLRAQSGPPKRTVYESRCGSEIAWLTNFDEAKRQAKAESKPIFWFVPTAYGSRMDRRQEVYWTMMGGAFMDESLIALIQARFVPLRLGLRALVGRSSKELPPRKVREQLGKTYGLLNLKFVEPGFLLLDADAKLVHTVDEMSCYNSDWMMNRLDRVLSANSSLGGAIKDSERLRRDLPKALQSARRHLREGNWEKARDLFESKSIAALSEAQYFAGACSHRLNETSRGDALWRALIKATPNDRWAWKAKLEIERWGPFMRGFEFYRDFGPRAEQSTNLRSSQIGGTENDETAMIQTAVEQLLVRQSESGAWADSIYDFGGVDSLPNVHVAVTAVTSLALLEWRRFSPERIDRALNRALPFLLDEKNTNPVDQDEIIWAHSYRLEFFARYCETPKAPRKKLIAKMNELVAKIEALRQKSGGWRHEYTAAFTTASVVHALQRASDAGVRINRGMLLDTGKKLAATRSDDGTFGYGFSKRGNRLGFSAGRMPICELAMFLCKNSDQARLEKAVSTSFEHHDKLEAVRKYDDHADRLGNGGFFFWYDMHGRSLAIDRIENPKKREAWKSKMRTIVRDIHEACGGWIDSHEVGKSYGTAMGLITLKLNQTEKP